MLEDAKIRFDFVDVEDTSSPRMSQLLALSNEKNYRSYSLRGLYMSEKNRFADILGLDFFCLDEYEDNECAALKR